MLKPYPFATQCHHRHRHHHHRHHHHPLPFPFNPIPKLNPSSIFLSPTHQQPILLCAAKNRTHPSSSQSQPSNLKILQLASIIALNLNILPQPFNFLAAKVARGQFTPNLPDHSILNILLGSRGKKKPNRQRRKKLAWLVLVPICCFAGFWSWRVSELDTFVRALLLGLIGFSLIRILLGKKVIKEWGLGFLVGVFLMMSCGLGKEDTQFWIKKIRDFSPASLIVSRNRNRNRNWKRNWRISK